MNPPAVEEEEATQPLTLPAKELVRIVSWNVNSLRAALKRREMKSVAELLDSIERVDQRRRLMIACFQETKLTPGELTEALACPSGFHAYFSMCKPRSGSMGYSGVVTYTRISPIASEEGVTGVLARDASRELIGGANSEAAFAGWTKTEKQEVDSEGRCVITDHRAFVLFNLYCPAITVDPDQDKEKFDQRVAFKKKFLHAVALRVLALRRDGRKVLMLGDLNVAATPLDVAWNCVDSTSPSRKWLFKLYKEAKMVDTFRYFHPHRRQYTCWSQVTGARVNNYGSRIDVIAGSGDLVGTMCEDAGIRDKVQGSDHCPIYLDFDGQMFPNEEVRGRKRRRKIAECHYTARFVGQKRIHTFFGPARTQTMIASASFSDPILPKTSCTSAASTPSSSSSSSSTTSTSSSSSSLSSSSLSLSVSSSTMSPSLSSPKLSKQWACPVCTLLNDSGASSCEVCTHPRPAFSSSKSLSSKKSKSANGTRRQQASLRRFLTKSKLPPVTTPADQQLSITEDFPTIVPMTSSSSTSLSTSSSTSTQSSISTKNKNASAKDSWRRVLTGKGPPAPRCRVHGLECLLRTVLKKGPNRGKKFYVCPLPNGAQGQKGARCDFFCWATVSGKPQLETAFSLNHRQ